MNYNQNRDVLYYVEILTVSSWAATWPNDPYDIYPGQLCEKKGGCKIPAGKTISFAGGLK